MSATTQMKTDHVYRKFSNNIEGVKELLQKNATFREICDNYGEICNWLDDYCRSQDRPTKECDHAMEIIQDLEEEINQVLREHGF